MNVKCSCDYSKKIVTKNQHRKKKKKKKKKGEIFGISIRHVHMLDDVTM